MVSRPQLLAFLPVCVMVVAVPGPSVMFTVGRALAGGRRSALLTVLGNGLGLATQAVVVAAGLSALLMATSGALLALKVLGGAYLVFLGIQSLRQSRADVAGIHPGPAAASTLEDMRAGVVVGLTNPKTLVFLAALLPQFVTGTGSAWVQTMVLGMVFAVVAILGDSVWALSAGTARAWLARSPRRIGGMRALGGAALIGLGVYSMASGHRSR